jgi:hypothetical protein
VGDGLGVGAGVGFGLGAELTFRSPQATSATLSANTEIRKEPNFIIVIFPCRVGQLAASGAAGL